MYYLKLIGTRVKGNLEYSLKLSQPSFDSLEICFLLLVPIILMQADLLLKRRDWIKPAFGARTN